MAIEKKSIEEINHETEKRISKAVLKFEKEEISQDELEKIVGAITLVGIQNKQKISSLKKVDFSKFLVGAEMI